MCRLALVVEEAGARGCQGATRPALVQGYDFPHGVEAETEAQAVGHLTHGITDRVWTQVP